MAATANVAEGPRFSKALKTSLPPIRNKAELKLYMDEINRLMRRNEDISESDAHYLSLLAMMVSDYERRVLPVSKSTPGERLQELLSARDVRPAAIAHIFGSGNVYDVLKGKRSISKQAAKKLSHLFAVSVETFL